MIVFFKTATKTIGSFSYENTKVSLFLRYFAVSKLHFQIVKDLTQQTFRHCASITKTDVNVFYLKTFTSSFVFGGSGKTRTSDPTLIKRVL